MSSVDQNANDKFIPKIWKQSMYKSRATTAPSTDRASRKRKLIPIINGGENSNNIQEWRTVDHPLSELPDFRKEVRKRSHPFSARVHFKRSEKELSAIAKDQRHSTHRRGIFMGNPEHIAKEMLNKVDEEPLDNDDSRELSPDHLSNKSLVPSSRASSSSMLFFSSGFDYLQNPEISESPIIMQDAATPPSIEYHGFQSSHTQLEVHPDTPYSPSSSVRNSFSSVKGGTYESLDDSQPSRSRLSSEISNHRGSQKLPQMQKNRASVSIASIRSSTGKSAKNANQEHMEQLMIMEQEISLLESRFQYFESVKLMQKCLSLMYSTYDSWNHEKVQKYAERLVAACNTFANQYLHGFPISGLTHIEAQQTVSEISQPDLLTAYSLLKIALHYCDERSPINFNNKSELLLLTWSNLTSYFRKTNNIQRAYRCCRKAYQYKKSKQNSKLKNGVKMPDNPAGIEINLGAVLSVMGRHHDSLKYGRLALNILLDEDLLLDDNQRWFPDNNTRRRILSLYSSLVVVHHNIAVELEHLNRMDEAKIWHEKALNISKIRLGSHSELTQDMHKALNEFYQHERGEKISDTVMLQRTRTGYTPIEQLELPRLFHSSTHNDNTIANQTTQVSTSDGTLVPTSNSQLMGNNFSLVLLPEGERKPVAPQSGKTNAFSRRFDMTNRKVSSTIRDTTSLNRKKALSITSKVAKARYNTIHQIYIENKVPQPPSYLQRNSARGQKFNATRQGSTKKAWTTPKPFHDISQSDCDDVHIDRALHHIMEQDLSVQNKAALLIQNNWRVFVSKKEAARRKFVVRTYAALFIQSIYRGHRLRAQWYNLGKAVFALQVNFRRRVTRNAFLEKKYACITIQRIFKGWSQRGLLQRQTISAIKIQQHARRFAAQLRMKRLNTASTKIQTLWRGYSVRKHHSRKTKAIVCLQRYWGKYLERIITKRRFRLAVLIERAWRKYKHHKQQMQIFNAATKIQSVWKKFKFRCQYQQVRNAAMIIQPIIRMTLDHSRIQKLSMVVIMLQAKHKQVLAEARFESEKRAALCISRHFRGYLSRKNVLRHHKAAITIQCAVRLYQSKKMSLKKPAAIKIQTAWRRYIESMHYSIMEMSARKIQLMWRASVARNFVNTVHVAQVQIARIWRGYKDRKDILIRNKAASKLQAFCKGCARRKLQKIQAEECRRIQTFFRSWLLRQRMRPYSFASTTISRVYRGFKTRKRLVEEDRAAQMIQRTVRQWLATNCKRKRIVELQRDVAAIIIQSWWRMILVHINIEREQNAAVIIQSIAKIVIIRRERERDHRAATTIQKCWRSYSSIQTISRRMDAARRIQVWWKYQLWLEKQRKMHYAAAKIQGLARIANTRKQLRILNISSIKIQSSWLRYLYHKKVSQYNDAARQIQRVWRSYSSRLQKDRENQAAYVIQHAWFRYWR